MGSRTLSRLYRFLLRAPGVASEYTRTNVWTSVTMRKSHRCVIRSNCDGSIAKGSKAWRPLSEGGGTMRTERVCDDCFEGNRDVRRELQEASARGKI